MAEVGAVLAQQTVWSFYLSWIDGFHKSRGCIPAVQSMRAVSAAYGASPASQLAQFWFPFPQFLVLLRVGFGGARLEGMNECTCIVHETLNYGSLEKVACGFFLLLFSHTFPLPWRAGQVSGWAQGQHSCSILCFQASPSQQTQRTPSEEAGGRWLGAQRCWEEHASISSTVRHPNPPQTRQILHSCQSFCAFLQGKSKAVCLAGCQPPGKDALGPAGCLFTCAKRAGGLCRGGSGWYDAGPQEEPLLQTQWEHGGSMLPIFRDFLMKSK